MSIHVALHHVTNYDYDRLINLGPQVVRLRPAPHCRTRILSYSLGIEPAKHFINWQQDPQANYLARLVFPETTRKLRIEVDLVAEMAVINPFDFFLEPHAEYYPFEYEPWQRVELAPYFGVESLTPLFWRASSASVTHPDPSKLASPGSIRSFRLRSICARSSSNIYEPARSTTQCGARSEHRRERAEM